MTIEEDLPALRARIEAEERSLIFPHFDHHDAWRLGNIIVALALERGHGVAVDITRGEQQVFHAALPGSSADHDNWIAGKIRTTRRIGISTLLARVMQSMNPIVFAWLEKPTFLVVGGCFPILMAGGALVGTLTVSGLHDTDDHDLAVEAIRLFLDQDVSGASTSF